MGYKEELENPSNWFALSGETLVEQLTQAFRSGVIRSTTQGGVPYFLKDTVNVLHFKSDGRSVRRTLGVGGTSEHDVFLNFSGALQSSRLASLGVWYLEQKVGAKTNRMYRLSPDRLRLLVYVPPKVYTA